MMSINDEGNAENGKLAFIKIPEEIARKVEGFTINPEIPIPVETGGNPDLWRANDLTWEAIITGMLRMLVINPEHEYADYYRKFILAVKPEIFEEFTEIGVFKAKNREFDIAEEIFQTLAGLFPEKPEPLCNLATVYEDKADTLSTAGNKDLAEEYDNKAFLIYKRLLALDDFPSEIWMKAGFFFLKKRNFEKARELFEAYIENGQDDSLIKKAEGIIRKLEHQGFLDNLFKEAFDFIIMGKEEAGIEKICEFLKTYPDVWNAWFLLGWAYRRLGRWEEGKSALQKAVDLGGNEADTYNELAICLMESGEYDKSKSWLEKALHKDPENVKIISNLGVLSQKRGNIEEATGFFKTALEIEPSDEIARKLLEELNQP